MIRTTRSPFQRMRSSELFFRNIWRASTARTLPSSPAKGWGLHGHAHPNNTAPLHAFNTLSRRSLNHRNGVSISSILISSQPTSISRPGLSLVLRSFTTSREFREVQRDVKAADDVVPVKEKKDLNQEGEERGFTRSEKATQAAQVNLSARLAKDGKSQDQTAGLGEIWRLIKIAKPEAKMLSFALVFLLISSSISMSIPFSIGKILDIATKADGGNTLFGLDITTFYIALGAVLTFGAGANYGRIIILRIVGERIVARLRSQLFRRTFVQNAEFFDANRVGDLISRLSSDTIIVGKSITQNLSDGLRSLVSGGAAFGLMAYVSLQLTGILTLMFPPVAIGAFFYGKAIRNLSRTIQKNLGTLTKIAEERLGNVRTSQAFAGEILEVARYNKQVKRIFGLGKREALISATFFSTVSIRFQVIERLNLSCLRPG